MLALRKPQPSSASLRGRRQRVFRNRYRQIDRTGRGHSSSSRGGRFKSITPYIRVLFYLLYPPPSLQLQPCPFSPRPYGLKEYSSLQENPHIVRYVHTVLIVHIYFAHSELDNLFGLRRSSIYDRQMSLLISLSVDVYNKHG